MSFEEAQVYLDSLGIDAMKSLTPSLTRIQALCEALNNPELAVPAIHITGTNGKTSTARIATSLLTATGLTVGTYTSPHLQTVRERIALNGLPISEDAFGEMFDHMRPYLTLVEGRLGEKLSYFEVLTALFFLWAAEAPVDVAVIEVGLGGRWDATNVVPAPVGVLTNIGFDHTELLGEDRLAIAAEKSGIIKPNSILVTAERSPDVLQVVRDEAARAGATLSAIEKDFSVTENVVAVGGRFLSVSTTSALYEELFLPLHGAHQGVNAATALEAVTRFLPAQQLDAEVVAEGFTRTTAPGRLESVGQLTDLALPLMLDVAHNPPSVSALVSSLIEGFAFESVIFVIGVLKDKDFAGMLGEMARVPCSLIFTEARTARAAEAEELGRAADSLGLGFKVIEGVPAAVSTAVQSAGPDELICITGSHYVVGEARTYLANR
jgi:dihydrofolate synthase/folylpolyglutamate synthase